MPGPRLSRRLRSRLLPLHRISRCNQHGLVRLPSLPCMRCPTESNIQMDGSLAQDLGLCPSYSRRMHYNLSNCSTPRTTPTPPTVSTRTVVAPPVVSTSQTVATPPTVVAQLVVSTPLWLLH